MDIEECVKDMKRTGEQFYAGSLPVLMNKRGELHGLLRISDWTLELSDLVYEGRCDDFTIDIELCKSLPVLPAKHSQWSEYC